MRKRRWRVALAALAVVGLLPAVAVAFDAGEEFAKGTTILSLQLSGGAQNNVEGHRQLSGVSFVGFIPRLTWLPFDPLGSGWLLSAVEVGAEGWFQHYLKPAETNAGGLKLALRYDYLGLGRLVPYVELLGGAGGTNLRTLEIRSTFTFVLEGGVGLSYFVASGVAVNGGYRFQHISNGDTSNPNRGFNSNEGVVGVSFFFQ